MEPGVPFALLGAVQLLAVAAWVGLAGASIALRGRVRGSAGVLTLGAVVLAATETLTALRFGAAASDQLMLVRAAGLLLLAAGLHTGALARRTPARPRPELVPAAPVVVPLGAAPGPALVAVAAALLAALGAARNRRDRPGLAVAGGLVLAGAAAAVAIPAESGSGAAVLVLLLRAASAGLLLGGLVALARYSLLAKVVAAILAGVLAVAAAAVGVVGTTVARGYAQEQAELVEDAADGREQLLQQVLDRTSVLAPVFASACTRADLDAAACDAVLRQLTEQGSQNFAVLVPNDGAPRALGGRAPVSPAEALGLAGSDVVTTALAGGATAARRELPARVRLLGEQPGLAFVVVQPLDRPTPEAPASAAFVYGVRVGQAFVDSDFDSGGFGLTLLAGSDVLASNLPERDRERIERVAADVGSLPPSGVTVPAEGTRPTVHLRPLFGSDRAQVATLALSRGAEESLGAQRDALRALLLAVLATTAVVAALALLLGRRTVEPVRRLTVAARRVARGDLAATAGPAGPDEVGTLSRTFDAMTGSLARLTSDLRSSAARLETVLSSMSDGLLATDVDGRVTDANPAALAMVGVDDAADVLGRRLAEVVDLRDGAGERIDVAASWLDDTAAEVHRPDGTSTSVRAAVAPLDTGDGEVLVLRDTTREREVERMKTEFLSNVSHELRTPLTPIRGYADILASRPGLTPEQVARFAGTILSESLKMNRVVDLLVDVAAIEAGRVQTEPRPVAPRDLLDARIEAWRGRAPDRAGDLRRRVAAGLPRVLVDPEWLAKALDELIDNAVKYSSPGTSITLTATTSPDGGAVRLAVRDAGPGIDVADQELLFTSFEQVDGSATRRVGGLGLGLSFVRRVAQDAGWALSVTSAKGRGSVFALDVPVVDEPQPQRRRRRVAARTG